MASSLRGSRIVTTERDGYGTEMLHGYRGNSYYAAEGEPIMDTETCVVFSTPLGWMCAAWRERLLRELTFGHRTPDEAVRAMKLVSAVPREPTRATQALVRRLQNFAQRAGDDFLDVELDLEDYTPFQCRVVAECRTIPIGQTVSYAELALRAGHPGAARAVGTVMSTNRFPLVVPCHRVVGSGGSLGGYSAPDGLDMKRRLLALEQSESEPQPKSRSEKRRVSV